MTNSSSLSATTGYHIAYDIWSGMREHAPEGLWISLAIIVVLMRKRILAAMDQRMKKSIPPRTPSSQPTEPGKSFQLNDFWKPDNPYEHLLRAEDPKKKEQAWFLMQSHEAILSLLSQIDTLSHEIDQYPHMPLKSMELFYEAQERESRILVLRDGMNVVLHSIWLSPLPVFSSSFVPLHEEDKQ